MKTTLQSIRHAIFSKNPLRRLKVSQPTVVNDQQQQQHQIVERGVVCSVQTASPLFDDPFGLLMPLRTDSQMFFSYYVGNSVLSLDQNSDGSANCCISKIVESSKVCKRKPRKVVIQVSTRGFRVLDCETSACIVDASIFRVSYVTLSPTNKNVYAFVCQNMSSKLIECHVFDCKSKHYAKNLFKSSFYALNTAIERFYTETDDLKRSLMLKESSEYHSMECDAQFYKKLQMTKRTESSSAVIRAVPIKPKKRLNRSLPWRKN